MFSDTAHDAKSQQEQSEGNVQHLLKLPLEVHDPIYTLAMEYLPTRFSFEYGMRLNALTFYTQILPLCVLQTNRSTTKAFMLGFGVLALSSLMTPREARSHFFDLSTAYQQGTSLSAC